MEYFGRETLTLGCDLTKLGNFLCDKITHIVNEMMWQEALFLQLLTRQGAAKVGVGIIVDGDSGAQASSGTILQEKCWSVSVFPMWTRSDKT